MSCVWDASSQLSFLAMLGLIYVAPQLQNLGKNCVTKVGGEIGWVTWLFLSYMLAIVNGFAWMPTAALAVGNIHPLIILAYYALL
jgi:hypothetical protein